MHRTNRVRAGASASTAARIPGGWGPGRSDREARVAGGPAAPCAGSCRRPAATATGSRCRARIGLLETRDRQPLHRPRRRTPVHRRGRCLHRRSRRRRRSSCHKGSGHTAPAIRGGDARDSDRPAPAHSRRARPGPCSRTVRQSGNRRPTGSRSPRARFGLFAMQLARNSRLEMWTDRPSSCHSSSARAHIFGKTGKNNPNCHNGRSVGRVVPYLPTRD